MGREPETVPRPGGFLDKIVSHVREHVALRMAHVSAAQLVDFPSYALPRYGLGRRLAPCTRRSIIAEVKRASPSRGLIREDFDPVAIARSYEANGAVAVSVVTEERFFQGSLDYLQAIRSETALPLLRKDFIIDPYQITEARSFGADAILLIAAILTRTQLRDLHQQAQALSLDTLVEVHTEAELDHALEAGAQIVGINNRDLYTFRVDLSVSERLVQRVPPGVLVVCESGIGNPKDLQRLETAGARIFLIGETLMREADPGAKLAELLA